jgi:predicted site-specific integrase-resolvase
MGIELLNSTQAAKVVGISLMTLQRWIALGKFRPPKLSIRNGRAVRLWDMTALERLGVAKAKYYGRGKGNRQSKS